MNNARARLIESERLMRLPTVKSKRTIALQKEVKDRLRGI
jgi:hypothetical protein